MKHEVSILVMSSGVSSFGFAHQYYFMLLDTLFRIIYSGQKCGDCIHMNEHVNMQDLLMTLIAYL